MVLVLFLSCVQPESTSPLPRLELPAHTLLLRESFTLRGTERSAGWRDHFDTRGCHRQAHNGWLWVSDPVLRGSDEPSLFWNRELPSEADFCLSLAEAEQLRRAVALAWNGWEGQAEGAWLERWTLVQGEQSRSVVFPPGRRPPVVRAIAAELKVIAEGGVWGQSPEGEPPPGALVGLQARP